MSRESGAGPERNGNGGGMSGNTGRGSGGSSSSGKGGGRNDSGGASSKGSSKSSSSSSKNDKMGGKQSSSQSTGYSSMGGASSYGMDKGSFANSIGANNEGKQAGKGGGKNDGTLSQRVKSVSSVAQAIASRPSASASMLGTSVPSYARPGYGDTINAQRQQLAGPTSSGASSAGTAASYGMTEDQFNKTIGTDNFNGTINNLVGKLDRGTASETDKASLGQAASDYNNLRGAGILGRIAGGALGKSAVQGLVGYAMDAPSDYLSGQARLAATGGLDTGRLTGQRGEVGDGSWKDSALNGVMSILGLAAPGAGLLTSAAGAAATSSAPGFGGLLNNMATQAGYSQTGENKGGGSSGDTRVTATSQTATPGQAESTLDENYRYDPTKYQFKGGTRAATPWSYN
ncbi:hypothetical protein Q4S47_00685 [Aeromonas caviae]|uniref:hypothetical protein n=1 Tax=Aeromonas caviae TaxID=648 RepID=UPI003004C7D1